MDVRLSAEQVALRDSAANIVDRLGPKSVRDLDDEERTAKLDAAVAASGWRELRTPEGGDAPMASGVEVALVAEELGRGLADIAFVGPTLAAELRRLAGAPLATAPESVVLAGVVIDASGAMTALDLLPSSDGYVLAEVGLGDIGEPVDLTQPTAAPLATPPRPVAGDCRRLSENDVTRWTALGLAVTSAELVGVMRGAITLSCDYAAQRKQYGAAIGSFQAVQHLLADAFVSMEGARSAMLHAAWAVDALAPADALAAAAVAKAYAARAARTVCETAIQVHGGIGNTWECLAHVYLRRALVSSDILGGAGTNVGRVLAHHGIGGTDGLR